MSAGPAIDVVVVSYDSADDLPALLTAVRDQLRVGDSLTIVDNHGADGVADLVRRLAPDAAVVAPVENLGFAGGANAGVSVGRSPLILLLNPDAVPADGCIDALRAVAELEPRWAAWQPLVTMEDGRLINTAGNVSHVLGLGWAGRCGLPVEDAPKARETCATASGAALVVRRDIWQVLGGFEGTFFMYCEDQDLSLRIRLLGHQVGIEPAARVDHGYDFSKGDYKWYLLERNRWSMLLAVYPARVLIPLLPFLAAFELALLALAATGGWLRPQARGQISVLRNLKSTLARRRLVQSTASVSAGEFANVLTTDLDSPYLGAAARVPGVAAGLRLMWWLVRPRR